MASNAYEANKTGSKKSTVWGNDLVIRNCLIAIFGILILNASVSFVSFISSFFISAFLGSSIEYKIEFVRDGGTQLDALGNAGWDVVSARRAEDARQWGYEVIAKRQK